MPVGKLPPFTEANDKPLQIDVRFWSDRAKTAEVEIATAFAWLNETDGDGYLAMTEGDGITIVDNVVQIRVTAEDMADVPAGEYDFEVLVTDTAGGSHEQRGKVTMLDPLAMA
jgi:hypothetical protein